MDAMRWSQVTKESVPLLHCFGQRWWQMFCFCLGFWNLLSCRMIIAELFIRTTWTSHVKNVRIDMVSPQNSSMSPLLMSNLQLKYNGCSVWTGLKATRTSLAWTLPDPIVVDGYEVAFAGIDASISDLRFTIFTSPDDWQTAKMLGASAMRWTPTGPRALPNACCGRAAFDGRPPWPWYIGSGSAPFIVVMTFGLLTSGLCSALGRLRLAAWTVGGGTGVSALLLLLAAAGHMSTGQASDSFLALAEGAALAALVAVAVCAERRFPAACTAAGAAILVARVVDDCIIFGDAVHLAVAPPVAAAGLALWGLAYLLDTWRQAAMAARRVAYQRPAYDRAWGALVATEGGREAAERLRALSKGALYAFAGPARHLNRCAPAAPAPAGSRRWSQSSGGSRGRRLRRGSIPGFAPGAFDHGVPATAEGTADAGCPVVSLDQLYSQALAAAPILLARWLTPLPNVLPFATAVFEMALKSVGTAVPRDRRACRTRWTGPKTSGILLGGPKPRGCHGFALLADAGPQCSWAHGP